jgi:hypothetical protein
MPNGGIIFAAAQNQFGLPSLCTVRRKQLQETVALRCTQFLATKPAKSDSPTCHEFGVKGISLFQVRLSALQPRFAFLNAGLGERTLRLLALAKNSQRHDWGTDRDHDH